MRQIYLWNSLTDSKQLFNPISENEVTMYVCGPTVYNDIHIGNARPIAIFDLLYRVLKSHFKQVKYVRNITDIDDKIIAKAQQDNCTVDDITQKYIVSFQHDSQALNILEPSVEPRATEYIKPMIDMIQTLIDKGFAYEAQGNVLFEVNKMQEYGKLSNCNVEDLQAGARVEVADYKKSHADFVLWKPSNDTQPGWDSPWGYGRPGWHLECSVMAKTNLGTTIDIHGGGKDLIFPHHENEIAQSVCAHDGADFAHYWIHNGYITVSGDKMSKSEGNFVTLKEILNQYPGEAVRLALFSVHYRKPLDWSNETVLRAHQTLNKWYRLLINMPSDDKPYMIDEELITTLDDNLNTPQAIAILHRIAHQATTTVGDEQLHYLKTLRSSANYMGLLEQDPQQWMHSISSASTDLTHQQIDKLIEQRNQARENKDFVTADEIRDQLNEAGVILEDSNGETRWSRR